MALKDIVVHSVKTNGAKCRGQRQHRAIGARELLPAELRNKGLRLKVEGELLDSKVL